jgi:sterol desaturase/sphingolipid hydroxylase (fatty acid hydroxylase superfamily)
MIMAIDFFEYWMHRAGHASKLYWNFHCIHHSPRELTPLAKFRVHWGDMIVFGAFKAVPLLILGHLTVTWMPILPLGILQVLSHFDIDLHYGPVLGRLLVSPRYHRVHHSADPAQYNTNFGIIFSCWDYIFRTANRDLTKPVAYGCPEMGVPESFVRQFFYPFILVARSLGLGGARPQPAGDAAAQ